MQATYSPEDNKLRLYSMTRLDKETYARVRAAGFIWAPKQDLFVAPMWTPQREDLLVELCGEVGDEDTSLVDRAEQRAERFEEYRENRAEDAEQARAAVARIADGIPMGQPILVGHHSERHARKDAEKIENGMRRAVKMWETSQYWKDRAAGAIRNAKYKERPDVRARRIKKIEADRRSQVRTKTNCEYRLKRWQETPMTRERALVISNHPDEGSVTLANGESYWSAWGALDRNLITAEEVQQQKLRRLPNNIKWCDRWIAHYDNRLEYERAMMAEAGGTEADRTRPEVGGACRAWCSWRGGYSTIQKVNKVSVTLLDNWGNGGKDFTRTIPLDKLSGLMSKAEVDAMRAAGRLIGETPRGFHLAPAPTPEPDGVLPGMAEHVAKQAEGAAVVVGEKLTIEASQPKDITAAAGRLETLSPLFRGTEASPQHELFAAMKKTLRAGIQVVSAPQLFPTPPALAARMAILADIRPEHNVLEPSAGTGALVREIVTYTHDVTAVEHNCRLAGVLANLFPSHNVRVKNADFLECNGDLGEFDRILMNPPFENASDVKHILHAAHMLKPGGRLVAICANGPQQYEALQPLSTEWEELEPGTFAGTNVRAVLLTIER